MFTDLRNTIAIVTGGYRGLGRAVSWALANAGAKVVIAAGSVEKCSNLARQIGSAGGDALSVRLDVTEPASVQAMFVNAIDPAGMATAMSDEVIAVEKASDEFAGTQTNRDPSQRLRPPEAIVPLVLFLLSEASDMMTGRLLQASSPDDVQYLQL